MYDMSKEERKSLGRKAKQYVREEFGYQKTIDLWHDSLKNLVEDWKENKEKRKQWTLQSL